MKKAMFVVAIMLALVSFKAWALVCPAGQHPGCGDSTSPPDPASGQACGAIDVGGALEIEGCANGTGATGCIVVAETVGVGSNQNPADEPGCDKAADDACAACGCAVCVPNAH